MKPRKTKLKIESLFTAQTKKEAHAMFCLLDKVWRDASYNYNNKDIARLTRLRDLAAAAAKQPLSFEEEEE